MRSDAMTIRTYKIAFRNFCKKFLVIGEEISNVTELDLTIAVIKIHADRWK